MAYLVLARKYRPKRFADMIGQEQVTRTLANAIEHDRVHHAYLFCGVRGLGKTTAARILAKCLVCEQGPSAEPCNECTQCVAIDEGRSVDVVEIDGASNNSVDDIRALRDRVAYLPHSARRKIYIIDEVHMLSASAFNALLKTLEEPPEHVTFLFATTDPHKVLPTIMSRVNRLEFRRVAGRTLIPHLESILEREGVSIDAEGLRTIALASEGSVRDALTLTDKVIAFAQDSAAIAASEVAMVLGYAGRAAIAELVDAILDRDATRTLRTYETITGGGVDPLRVALDVLRHLRDLTVLAMANERELLLDISDDLFERMQAQVERSDATRLSQCFDRLCAIVDGLEDSRVPGLVVEMGMLDLVSAEPLVPVADLVDRLRNLEGGASGGAGGSGSPSGPAPRNPSGQAPRGSGRGRSASPANAATRPPPVASAPASAQPPQRRESSPAAPTPSPAPNSAPTEGPRDEMAEKLWAMVRKDGAAPMAAPPPDPPASEPTTPTTTFTLEAPRDSKDQDAACPGSAVLEQVIDTEGLGPFEVWTALLERIRGQDDLLFAVLADLGLMRLGQDHVELAAAAGFGAEQLRENPELRQRFADASAACLGRALRIDLTEATPCLPDLPSLALVEAQRASEQRDAATADAMSNPGIRALLRTFDAKVEEVEVLGES